jgi:hypothetical protein
MAKSQTQTLYRNGGCMRAPINARPVLLVLKPRPPHYVSAEAGAREGRMLREETSYTLLYYT